MENKYYKYLASWRWTDKRNWFLKNYGWGCFICGKKKVKLQVHHIHYKSLENESKKDLMAVCSNCHEKIHRNELIGQDEVWNFKNTENGETEIWH